MLNLDDLFRKGQFDHPKLRFWQASAERQGTVPVVEVHRPREGLGFGATHLYVSIQDKQGGPILADGEPWEPLLALATVERGWRAPTAENEAVRFGLLLKTFFSQPETRYGDGYFSSVLVQLVRGSDIGAVPSVSEVLHFVQVYPPSDSPSRVDCEENIKAVLARVADLLVGRLEYTKAEAKGVMANALAYYLDDRFSITSGRQMGLYRNS